jgi:regulation of enolase protein 1 (concanavalin A-like superfamily)
MKLTAFFAAVLAFFAIAEEPEKWQVAGTKPLVLQGWGTVRDIYGLARFSQQDKALSVEVAGGGGDFTFTSKVAPCIFREIEGDFEATVAIEPGMFPDGTNATSNRVLWNGAGLVLEADEVNYARIELSVRQPAGKKDDNRLWVQHVVARKDQWDQPSLKDVNAKRPLHLRIQRAGPQFKWAYSYDKEMWTELKPFEAKDWPAKLKVGLLFVNLTTKVQKVTVSDLKITRNPPATTTSKAE